MLRISVTTIEAYRYFLEYEWKTEAELIANIRGEFTPNNYMRAGTAFHNILETPEACRTPSGYASGGIAFDKDSIDQCLALYDQRGAFEVKTTKDYHVNGETVTVVAKADQLLGLEVVETKTKWAPFDIDGYLAACQWRYYLDIFEARRACYKVFCLEGLDDAIAGDGVIELKSIETFNVYPYPALHSDCTALVTDFVEYVNFRKLRDYLLPRVA